MATKKATKKAVAPKKATPAKKTATKKATKTVKKAAAPKAPAKPRAPRKPKTPVEPVAETTAPVVDDGLPADFATQEASAVAMTNGAVHWDDGTVTELAFEQQAEEQKPGRLKRFLRWLFV